MLKWCVAGMVLMASAGALQAGTPVVGAATVDVAVEDFQFSPGTVNVTAGDTVRWTWSGSAPHDVQADDGSFDSGDPVTGGQFTRVFDTPGAYAYYCTVHGAPGGVAMSGVVNVAAADTPTATVEAEETPTLTPTEEAEPTDTPAAEITTAPATATPVVVANPNEVMPISAPEEASATGGAAVLPSAGGRAGHNEARAVDVIAMALAVASLTAFAGAGVAWVYRRE